MEPYRTKLDPQEEAHLEALIRREAGFQELADWRVARRIHHKSFHAAVRRIRDRIDAPPSPMVMSFATLERPVPPAVESPAVELPAVIPSATAQPSQIEPVIHWLTAVRAMRDELAGHGVTVSGSLRIEIEL